MDNKGFTLVELIITISLIAIVSIVVVKSIGNTMSLNEDAAYKIMQNSVINATDKYLLECENQVMDCNYEWINNKVEIAADTLIEAGYFTSLVNPINEEDISKCLIIEVTKEENDYKYSLNDNDCK